jgi:hypothetical protein
VLGRPLLGIKVHLHRDFRRQVAADALLCEHVFERHVADILRKDALGDAGGCGGGRRVGRVVGHARRL